MILRINPLVFQSDDELINESIIKILDYFIEDRFILDFIGTGLGSVFFDENNKFIFNESQISSFILPYKKSILENKIKSILRSGAYTTDIFKFYFKTIKVGLSENEMHPSKVVKIISERSIIIVENYPNDWKFIEGLINKYQNFGLRREIYKKIKFAFDNKYIIHDHAGGSGIQAQLKGWENLYSDFLVFNVMVFIDSDKDNLGNYNVKYNNLLTYLKKREVYCEVFYEETDLVIWHMLYKTALENYVPIDVIKVQLLNLSDTQIQKLNSLNIQEVDFIVYHKHQFEYINIGKSKVKDQFPQMFLADFSPILLEERCSHHKVTIELPNGSFEQISEMEQILLKIAKII